VLRYDTRMNFRVIFGNFRGFLSRLNRLRLLCLLLLLQALTPAFSFAVEVGGLYQTEQVVVSRDDERERNRAFTRGLADVLLKLSGRQQTLNAPAVKQAMQTPQSYVEGWAYQTRTSAIAGEPAQLILQISYFQPQIQRVLEDAGIPLWPANRPETLIWVVVQDELGERKLAEPLGEEAELYAAMQAVADQRALPLQLPLMDLEDRFNLSPDKAWIADQDALLAASKRYGIDSVLSVRLFRTLTGETFAKASYYFRDTSLVLEDFEQTESQFLTSSVNMVAEELVDTFAVRISGVDNGTRVNLAVSGVRKIADYANLLTYLRNLAVVTDVQVLAVDGEDITLQLKTGGQLRQLMETLSLETTLQQLSEPMRSGQEFAIRYAWQSR